MDSTYLKTNNWNPIYDVMWKPPMKLLFLLLHLTWKSGRLVAGRTYGWYCCLVYCPRSHDATGLPGVCLTEGPAGTQRDVLDKESRPSPHLAPKPGKLPQAVTSAHFILPTSHRPSSPQPHYLFSRIWASFLKEPPYPPTFYTKYF